MAASISGGTIVVTLEGRDLSLGQMLSRIEAQMKNTTGTARAYDTTMTRLSSTQARTESTSLAYAQSLARGAAAAGDYAGAQRILVSALQQVTPNTTAASNAVNQLNRTIDQATVAQQKQASVFTNLAGGFNKLIGAYFAVSQAAHAFGAIIETGNQLEKQQTILRALSGTTDAYATNLAAAKRQQDLFGGSLADNVEGVANFANLSRRTGIEIEKLTNLARGLATIDPAQGFKGAGIALKEFFSGDITSLARRFEIPRDALNNIKAIADESERFRALEQVLAQYGVTQELIAAQANTTAVAYEKLGGAATDAVAAIGQALGSALKPAADELTKILTETSENINTLRTAGDTKLNLTDGFIAASESADQFNAKIQTANQQIIEGLTGINAGIFASIPSANLLAQAFGELAASGLKFQELTAIEFEFAKASQAAGASSTETLTAIQALQPAVRALDDGFKQVGESAGFTRQELDGFQQAMLLAAATGEAGRGFAQALADEVLRGGISVQDATFKLQAYSIAIAENNARLQEKAQAEQFATQAAQAHTTALGQSAIEAQNASIETAKLKALQEGLASISGAVANGHLTAANGAAQLAAQYNIATAEAERLINAQLRLSGIQSAVTATTPKRRGQEGGLLGNLGADPKQVSTSLDFLEAQKRRATELLQSEIALARAKGDTAGAIALMRKQQDGLNKSSAEFKNIEAQIISLENSAAKKKGGGAKSPKLTENEKLHNQLATQEDKFNAQMEDAERKHQQNLIKIMQDFAKKQLQTQNENEILKRRSRFDFYTNLNQSNLAPVDKQAFSAAYEEAFAEAQKIAQSGRAKLAQEFLELRKRQIEELQQLAEEEASIKSDKDLSKDERAAQLRALEERRKMLLDAQREEQKQLLEGGDKNQNELTERLNSENQAYSDQVDQIALNAGRAADAKIAAAERAKKVVSQENQLYADQIALLDQISQKNGGKPVGDALIPPTPVATNPTGQQPVPIDAANPIPVTTDAPLSVTTPEVQLVKQQDIFIVRDQAVIETIVDQTIRLEAKMDMLNQTFNNMGLNLGSKIDALKGSVGRGNNLVSP